MPPGDQHIPPMPPGDQHLPAGMTPGSSIPPGGTLGPNQLKPASFGNQFGVHVENIYAADAEDVGRSIASQQQLAMLRFAGRPGLG
jgi:hypothetical protein